MFKFDKMEEIPPPDTTSRSNACKILCVVAIIVILLGLVLGTWIWIQAEERGNPCPHELLRESRINKMRNVTLKLGSSFTINCTILNFGIYPHQKITWTTPADVTMGTIGRVTATTKRFTKISGTQTINISYGISKHGNNDGVKCTNGSMDQVTFRLNFIVLPEDEGWWTCRTFVPHDPGFRTRHIWRDAEKLKEESFYLRVA